MGQNRFLMPEKWDFTEALDSVSDPEDYSGNYLAECNNCENRVKKPCYLDAEAVLHAEK